MARIIFVSEYLRGGQQAAQLANRTRYFATRTGVEFLRDEHSNSPATIKQQEYVQRLARSFPKTKDLMEYEDYLNNPTRGNAQDYIEQVCLMTSSTGSTDKSSASLETSLVRWATWAPSYSRWTRCKASFSFSLIWLGRYMEQDWLFPYSNVELNTPVVEGTSKKAGHKSAYKSPYNTGGVK